MKQPLSLFLCLSLLAPPFSGLAAVPSETDENYTYYFIDDFIYIGKYTGEGGIVTLPTQYKNVPITGVDGYAFQNCETLTELIVPEGITYIGNQAFQGCKNLTTISLPAALAEIGPDAFGNCPALTVSVTPGTYAETYAMENNLTIAQ